MKHREGKEGDIRRSKRKEGLNDKEEEKKEKRERQKERSHACIFGLIRGI